MKTGSKKFLVEILLLIGFAAEVFFFSLAGYFLALNNFIVSIVFFVFGLINSIIVGELMKKDAVNKYKESING